MYIMYDLKTNHYNCDFNILHCKQNYIKGFRKLSMHSWGSLPVGDLTFPPPPHVFISLENPSQQEIVYFQQSQI